MRLGRLEQKLLKYIFFPGLQPIFAQKLGLSANGPSPGSATLVRGCENPPIFCTSSGSLYYCMPSFISFLLLFSSCLRLGDISPQNDVHSASTTHFYLVWHFVVRVQHHL